jgi:hypothetical protein
MIVGLLFIELFNQWEGSLLTFLSKGCLPIPQLFGARNLLSHM